jgi:molybdate transport system substrate-binding protein
MAYRSLPEAREELRSIDRHPSRIAQQTRSLPHADAGSLTRENPATSAFAAQGAGADTLTVFADASLAVALGQVKDGFERDHHGLQVQLHLADSATLRSELSQGSTADVLVAMDMATIDAARADGTVDGDPSIFAHQRLAMVVPADNPSVAALQDLARPGLRLVAELDSVPAGAAARQALQTLSADPAYGGDFAEAVLDTRLVESRRFTGR